MLRAGCRPVLVDCDPESWCLDVAQVEHKLTDRVSLRAEYRLTDWRGGVGVPDNASYFEGQEIAAALLYSF